jgi:pimeloyl-ACP methyl ester carboxylesterase
MGLKIHLETYGEGEQEIVVCNGLSQTTANWRSITRQNPDFRWIIYDARGHGRTQPGPRPYHLDDHVSDLLQVLDEAECRKPVLMGFSHGARVALRAAATEADRFAALVLVALASRVTNRRRAHVQAWWNCLRLGGVEAMAWASLPTIIGCKVLAKFPDLTLLVKGSVARNNREGLDAMFEGMVNYPPVREDAVRVSLPSLIMRGGKDPLVEPRDAHELGAWIADARVTVFEDCGHTLPLEEPQRFMDTLRTFIGNTVAVA